MKRILIVDDDRDFLGVLSSVLKKQFETYEATGIEDALKILETASIDAICSDFIMRDGTGIELLRMLRQNNVQIPFLCMSGMDDSDIIDEVESLGAEFCCKTDLDLLTRIVSMLNATNEAGDYMGK